MNPTSTSKVKIDSEMVYDSTGFYIDGERVGGSPFLEFSKDAIIVTTPWPIFENEEVVEPTCDTENPEHCDACE